MPSFQDLQFDRYNRRDIMQSRDNPDQIDLSENLPLSNINQQIPERGLDFSKMTIDKLFIGQQISSQNFLTGVSGWIINGNGDVEFNAGYFRGTLVAGSIHIPNQDTTANSMHVNSAGDTWWGCTETQWTADHANATAYILKTGEAVFKNITLTGGSNPIILLQYGEVIPVDTVVRIMNDGKVYMASSISAAYSNTTLGITTEAKNKDEYGYVQIANQYTGVGLSLTTASFYYLQDGTYDVNDLQDAASWGNLYNGSGYQFGRPFATAAGTSKLDWIETYGLRVGTGCGNLTFNVYALSGGYPTGAVLASTAAQATGGFATSGEWQRFYFSAPFVCTPSTNYGVLVVADGGNSSNRYAWRTAAGGTAGFYNDGSWHGTQIASLRTGKFTGTIGTTPGTVTKAVGLGMPSNKILLQL